MVILATGLLLFLLAFFFHLLIWRIRIPHKQTKTLLLIFFGTLILGFVLMWLFPSFYFKMGLYIHGNLYEYLHILLLFTSLTLAYITTYSGIEVDSPSLVMTMIIKNAGSKGITEEEFKNMLTDDILVKPRIRDLVRDNLLCLKEGKYKITSKGKNLAAIFIFYRKLLNVTNKGG